MKSSKMTRKIIQIDEEKCDGCGSCVPACAEGAIRIVDGVAKVIADKYCDGLGACLGDCPKGALKLVERQADAFDEQAVHAMLKARNANAQDPLGPKLNVHEKKSHGCPSGKAATFPMARGVSLPNPGGHRSSALGHWPVQLRLIPANAPFLKDANLLVTADCVPVACPLFQSDYLKGNVVMLGCPKFDDADLYVDKLTEIFVHNNIKKITMMIMEVPCCSNMKQVVESALEKSGKIIPVQTVTISTLGEPLA